MDNVISFPIRSSTQQITLPVQHTHQTLAQAICAEIGIPESGKAIALRLGRPHFFSNVQAVSIWLTENVDSKSYDVPDVFELVDAFSLLLNRDLKKLHR